MNSVDILVDAFLERVRAEIAASAVRVVYGTWMAEEDDVTLSQVTVEGTLYRNVRKLGNTSSLSLGNTVMCIAGPSWPLTIIDRLG